MYSGCQHESFPLVLCWLITFQVRWEGREGRWGEGWRERGRLTDGGSQGNMRLESSDFYLFKFFFLIWTILIVFIDFVTMLLLFLCFDFFFFFLPRGIWNLSFLTRDQTPSPSLEGKVLTAGPLEKAPKSPTYKSDVIEGCLRDGHTLLSLVRPWKLVWNLRQENVDQKNSQNKGHSPKS